MVSKVLWVGLGNMGRGMSRNLANKGNISGPLLLWNRSPEPAQQVRDSVAAEKTRIVASLQDGIREADVVLMCLGSDKVVEDTVSQILEIDIKGKLIVDCSTVFPDLSNQIGRRLVSVGASFVAAPVFGSPTVADAGQLIAILAGPADSLQHVRPYFEHVMARATVELPDEEWGKASLLKIVGNSTFILGMVSQLSEAHVLAEKTDLGTEYVHQFVGILFGEPYTGYSSRMIEGDYYKRQAPLVGVDIAIKDVTHASTLAESRGAELTNLKTGMKRLHDVKLHAGTSGDFAGMYGVVRTESGLKYENGS